MNPPLIVVEGSSEAVDHARAELEAAGWKVIPGWRSSFPRGGRVVHIGEVVDQSTAEAALLAALDGVGVVVDARCGRELTDRLIDDLRRLGPVEHRIGLPAAGPSLSGEARAILGLLAEGHSLGEAAAVLGLSRRTADRRVLEARRALGVERTTEAIARAKRLGWLRRPPPT
ncbi:MAG TPA: hypothetical protein VFC71_04035 [Candidatus Polarisedimenticolia bacterium]|nr:hypothetical protein [Candidatus Polarisedimenticolia bacterium]